MQANDKLKSVCEKKIKTTMIGAIDAIEKEFRLNWDRDRAEYLSENSVSDEFLDIITDIRYNILKIGNNQIRAIKNEIDEYFDIKSKIYKYTFTVEGNDEERS